MQKLIAFYLPQFYPIQENDEWWGKGFTEWTNVSRAKPLFKAHNQPRIPTDLGYYDLRVQEVREAQATLAKEAGIYGFCYYHYWFNGRQVLDRPFREVLQSGEPDFPFCLCWANENWTRVWNGENHQILIEQTYSVDDDRNHIQALLPAFQDPRYIRFEGKPIFLIYKASKMPNPNQTLHIWRQEAVKAGVGEIYLCRVESNSSEHTDPRPLGFDAAVEFQPDWNLLRTPMRRSFLWRAATRIGLSSKIYQDVKMFEYDYLVNSSLEKPATKYRRFPCVTPRWDNTPRRKKGGLILLNSSPEKYKKWLIRTMQREADLQKASSLVFINAWNEWGEGNYLEPDSEYQCKYLEATQEAILAFRKTR